MSSEKYLNHRHADNRRIMTISILAVNKIRFARFQLWLKEKHPNRKWYQGEVLDEIISNSPVWWEFLAQDG